jgi:hypothetical protein
VPVPRLFSDLRVLIIDEVHALAGTDRGTHLSSVIERIAQFTGQTKGAYVMLPMTDAILRDQMGYGFEKSTQLPLTLTKGNGTGMTYAFFGNWRDVLIATWASLVLRASDVAGNATGSAFLQNQIWIVGDTEVDINVMRLNSLCYSADVISPTN